MGVEGLGLGGGVQRVGFSIRVHGLFHDRHAPPILLWYREGALGFRLRALGFRL